jgi:hypothetical protein
VALIIGLSGFLGSGKTAAAEHLVQQEGFKRVSFADPLKRVTAELFGWDVDDLRGLTPKSRQWREQPDDYWSKAFGKTVTPRWALQYVGTELVRENLLSDFWTRHMELSLTNAAAQNQDVVIDDMRFQNEIALLRTWKATLVWVVRDDPATMQPDLRTMAFGQDRAEIQAAATRYVTGQNVHPSESDWLKQGRLSFDRVLQNDGTLDDLCGEIKTLVEDLRVGV